MITDMETMLIDYSDRIYRFWVYRKMFTPYEQQNAFMDESEYEDIRASFGIIQEAIDLGNGDWLLGFAVIFDGELSGGISYYRLNEIRLEYWESDQGMLCDDECEEGD